MNDNQKLKILIQGARTKHLLESTRASEYIAHTDSYIPKEFIRMDPWEIEYLYMLGKQAKVGILEIGRFLGGSSAVLAHANDIVPIYSIDLQSQTQSQYDGTLAGIMHDNHFGSNVQLILGDSQNSKYEQIKQYDLLFIDGDHSFEGCLADLNNWWEQLVPGGHVVCHDCYFGNDVQDAVKEFLKGKNITVCIDPHIQPTHWLLPLGSLCHFQKIN